MHRFVVRRAPDLRGKLLVVLSDSITNAYAFNAGSTSSPETARLLREMSDVQLKYEFDVIFLWFPREYNLVADLVSKRVLVGRSM